MISEIDILGFFGDFFKAFREMKQLGIRDAVDRLTACARQSRVDFLSHYPSK